MTLEVGFVPSRDPYGPANGLNVFNAKISLAPIRIFYIGAKIVLGI